MCGIQTLKNIIDFLLVVKELKWRKEAERAEIECHHWRHTFLQ